MKLMRASASDRNGLMPPGRAVSTKDTWVSPPWSSRRTYQPKDRTILQIVRVHVQCDWSLMVSRLRALTAMDAVVS
jgi:hypothetical protein